MFTPSKYQLAVFHAVDQIVALKFNAIMIEAVAGSGKTTTIVNCMEKIPSHWSVVFVAFNRHIRDDLIPKIPWFAQADTMNGLGWKICLKAFPKCKLEQYKTGIIYKNFCSDEGKYYRTRNTVAKLVSLLKANAIRIPTNDDIYKLCEEHDIKWDAPEIILQVFKACISRTDIMDYDDQVFMPWYLHLPVNQVDLLLVDEVQDLNPIMLELILMAGKRHICVGDSRQAIYGFRGADPESMANVKRRLGAQELPLSICYRCPKSVVLEAKNIVPQIEFAENAIDGKVETISESKYQAQLIPGDFVLCRTTAPLVSGCLKMIKAGKKATVKGRDIGENLVTLVQDIAGKNKPVEEFLPELQAWANRQRSRLVAADKEAEIIILDDQVDTISAVSESCNDVNGIINKFLSIFTDDKSANSVVFCTVHRSKGLEAKNIYILKPELMPHPSAKKPWQQKQEMNLKYVAITRSLENLYWVH